MYKEEDYFIPALAPYVEWVKAYQGLISDLYDKHKTVRKTWKAFRDAIPGVEQRLQFAVFEQILLFSLFLSEWNEGAAQGGLVEKAEQGKPASTDRQEQSPGSGLDTVIQTLQETIDQTDRALADFSLHHKQNTLILKDQETCLERQATSLGEGLAALIKEVGEQDGQFERVIQEIVDDIGNRRPILVGKEERRKGPVQAVIHWSRQGGSQEVIQNTESKIPLKKIGRWNAQRSRDGYYRLYRKIGGRVHSIYIGKHLDLDKAEKRIADKERELLRPDSGGEGLERTDIRGQMKMDTYPRVISVPGDDN
ncbi:MAG TPA: hypothetical protein VEF34_11800 [Syntrophobacteraceae bacterium]|nr:hypothetical protein [Syntrophobacteraceae bacterium]